MKFLLVFLVLFLTTTVNLPDGVLARLGLDPDYLLATLVALAITGLITHRRLLLIVLVVLTSLGANLPAEYMLELGVDRDVMFATLIALVVTPYVEEWLER